MTEIHIDSDAIRQATAQIKQSIDGINDLATDMGGLLDSNAGAYGEGDVDAKDVRDALDEIKQTISDNAQTLSSNIQTLEEYANEMDNTAGI